MEPPPPPLRMANTTHNLYSVACERSIIILRNEINDNYVLIRSITQVATIMLGLQIALILIVVAYIVVCQQKMELPPTPLTSPTRYRKQVLDEDRPNIYNYRGDQLVRPLGVPRFLAGGPKRLDVPYVSLATLAVPKEAAPPYEAQTTLV